MVTTRHGLWKIRNARRGHLTTSRSGARRHVRIPLPASAIAISFLAVVAIGLGVLVYNLIPRAPGDDSAEAGFLRDMHTHHVQAVEMSMILHDRTDDPYLLAMTTEIALTQSNQLGMMQGYLDGWGLSLTSANAQTEWMGHPVEGLMPGMATPEQIEQLRSLPVADAEVLFLQLMIRHHQGGVEMADALVERSDEDRVVSFAERIAVTQRAEIETMNAMLVDRGQQPITDPLPDHSEMDM